MVCKEAPGSGAQKSKILKFLQNPSSYCFLYLVSKGEIKILNLSIRQKKSLWGRAINWGALVGEDCFSTLRPKLLIGK